MRCALLMLLILLITGCGQSDDAGNGLKASSIPDAHCAYYSSGSHLFQDKMLLPDVTAFNCGVRENKLCWYYVATPTKTEVVCN